jgi:pSer/pThr/pTyr-binding forkhead associated (FHA) protein
MWENTLLKIRLSLKGRPIRTYVFNQDCVAIGRNPEADVHLDNEGISRDHLKIERTPGGFLAEDLNSANGTFVNDRPIKKQYLQHEDVIRIGKFSLWVSLEEDRRASAAHNPAMQAGTMGGTTVLTTSELQEMMAAARQSEPEPPPDPKPEPVVVAATGLPRRAQVFIVLGLLFAFTLGSFLGAGAMWYVCR